MKNKKAGLETKQADMFFCFYNRIILKEIIKT
jgi:hypothetical protein